MENDIIDAINDIGYEGPLKDKAKLLVSIAGGPKDIEFTKFVSYLSNLLRQLCNIDEHVNEIKGPEDSISFLLELSSFLKELGCPYTSLTQGHMSDRLSTDHDKLLLLEYLLSELMAAQMLKTNNPEKNIELKLQESPTAADLKLLLLALKFNKPPPNISPAMLFQKVQPKLQETVKLAGADLTGKPLFNGFLSDKQWHDLTNVQKELDADYTIRREMLLKRLDCTIQSFQWSDRLKGKEDQIVAIYHGKRKLLKVDPGIDISDVLAARDDLAIIEKTSNASVRKNTKTSLNKLIIGKVPDRGGRPSEQAPPPAEMPSWQQRSAGPSLQGGGGRGGGRGGYSRGGGQQQQGYDNNRGDNYNNYNQSGHTGAYNNQSAYTDRGYNNQSQQSGPYNNQSGYSGDRYGNQSQQAGGYGQRGGGRSYDSFQHNKMGYADQYVQDSQQNQQYGGRGRDYDTPRGQRRGRSNYNRGNYR
ncbi:uncharacterized protein CBL_02586 [Carabus blaptoides fortunei]